MLKQKRVIISLTSFPAAIPYAVRAIRSILNGSVKPDKVILYLTFSQFPDGKIPAELQKMMDETSYFEIINYEKDIRSYRKLIPALIDFPDDIIVTIDDDVAYHKDMLRSLLNMHEQYPDAILAHRAKRVKLNAPYRKWKKYRWYCFIAKRLHFKFTTMQTGVGGVLYPPNSLKKEMLDPEIFTKIAPTTDDIWFWAAAVANGTKVMPIPFGRHNKPRGLGKPREISLKNINFKSGTDFNRTALEKILEKYPIIKQRIENEFKIKKSRRVIVSLTSFPAAIQYAVPAIRSVLNGAVKPDKMVLYLTASQFPKGKLPPEITSLVEEYPMFEVRFYEENIRSYTKLIPALKDFPDDIIVTIDDDVAYNRNMLRGLLRLHKLYPDAIIGHRVRRLKLNAPYDDWKRYKKHRYFIYSLRPKFGNVQTGVGGVLYPPNSLKSEMLDPKIFMEMAPTVDDIWLWASAVANGTKIAPTPFGYWKLDLLGKPNEISLINTNVMAGKDVNRTVLQNILDKYPIIRKRIEVERSNKLVKLILKGIRRLVFLHKIKRAEKKFNGRPLVEVQDDIKNTVRKLRHIYLRDEDDARRLADKWNGSLEKPENLRFIENAVPVVMCANEKFAPYLAVMLQSLMVHSNPQRAYHFMIFGRDFADKTQNRLSAQTAEFPNCSIDIVNTRKILDSIPITAVKGLSVDAFARLLIPYWLDKYEKVIYLDSDMFARADIAELYDIDIEPFSIGLTPCAKTGMFLKQRKYEHFMKRTAAFMFLDKWENYINSGVVVFNTKKFAEKFQCRYLFKFTIYYTNRYYKRFNDQDVLALLVKDDYYILPPEWNYCWNVPIDGVKYRPASPEVKIIHLSGSKKPWLKNRKIDNNPDCMEYRRFARAVPLFNDSVGVDLFAKRITDKKIIVSLTSFPAAIPFAVKAIRSVLNGSVKPDKVVLYLTASQFPDGNIPLELRSLLEEDPMFEVRFCKDNIRSYTKLIPAIADFPDDIIVTVDDDILYHKNMLSSLLHCHKQYPDIIFAHRAKKLTLNAPYKKWKKYRWYWFLAKKWHFNFNTMQTGVGGVLYPPDSLNKDMLNSEIFSKLAPTTDDIWFWAAAAANGTMIVPVPFGRFNKPRGLGKPKALSLKTVNFKSGIDLNRAALEKIIENYPILKQRIEYE